MSYFTVFYSFITLLYSISLITYIVKMASKFPSASHLRNDEIDYELVLRNYGEDRKSGLEIKQRLLRRLFQEDAKENREYRPPHTLEQELDLVGSRVDSIDKALSKGPDTKLESRLKHYLLRIQRCEAPDERALGNKNALVERIRDLLKIQWPKGNSGHSKASENSGDESEARGGTKSIGKKGPASPETRKTSEHDTEHQADSDDSDSLNDRRASSVKKKISRKSERSSSEKQMKQEIYELKSQIQVLLDRLSMTENSNRQSPNNFLPPTAMNRSPEQPIFQHRNQFPQPVQLPGIAQGLKWNSQEQRYNIDRLDHPNNQNVYSGVCSRGQESSQRGLHSDDRTQYDRKIEKWNIYFSGDSKSTTLEDFIFKVKVLASMNGIPRNNLFSHIHLLLRGDATDWFFTYYEPDWDWATFETRIRFRFGNPNQDQGNRQRIYERKQQKGETFIAFVTDIERLNKLLTIPLSNERKYEIIWENMRQHYRSKLACFKVTNLDELVQVNHRIDASDPSLHPIAPRHTIHNLEAESHEDDSGSEQVNAIEKKQYQNQRPLRSQVKLVQETRSDNLQGVTRLPHCWNCRNQGHFWRECKEPKTLFCYVCGNPGKVSSTCDSHPRKPPQNYASVSSHNSGN